MTRQYDIVAKHDSFYVQIDKQDAARFENRTMCEQYIRNCQKYELVSLVCCECSKQFKVKKLSYATHCPNCKSTDFDFI